MIASWLRGLRCIRQWKGKFWAYREDFRFHRLQTSQRACVDGVSNLLTHAVDAIRPQQVDSLLHQVSAATAQHTEAQVLQEFRFSGGGIQSPRGTDTVIRSKVGKARNLQHKEMHPNALHF